MTVAAKAAVPGLAVAVNVAAFALLAWLYGGDVADGVRVGSSEVAALTTPPNVPFAAVVLALAVAGLGLTAGGALTRRDRSWRGYRVMPIVLVLALAFDLFVLSSDQAGLSSAQRAAAALQIIEHELNERSNGRSVETDPKVLEQVVEQVGDAPWLVRGRPAGPWRLEVQRGCTGPRLERGSAAAGTLFYCVSADATQAWLTAVGLPVERRFGPAQLFAVNGVPLVRVVTRIRSDSEERPEQPVETAGQLPLRSEADAGNL